MKIVDVYNLTAKRFNHIISEVKKRLDGRDLLCFSMENSYFSQTDADNIDINLLHQLCSKAYHISILKCRLRAQMSHFKTFILQIVETTASLQELELWADGILTPETTSELLDQAQ